MTLARMMMAGAFVLRLVGVYVSLLTVGRRVLVTIIAVDKPIRCSRNGACHSNHHQGCREDNLNHAGKGDVPTANRHAAASSFE